MGYFEVQVRRLGQWRELNVTLHTHRIRRNGEQVYGVHTFGEASATDDKKHMDGGVGQSDNVKGYSFGGKAKETRCIMR